MQEPGEEAKGFLKVILIVTAIGIFTVVLGSLLFFSFRDLLTGNTFAIIPLLLGGYTVYVIIRRGFEMRRLAVEGVETAGTVTRKIKFPRRRYQIKYDFTAKTHYRNADGSEFYIRVPRSLKFYTLSC
jgi:hypothetical protein